MSRYSPYPLPRKPYAPKPVAELLSTSPELAPLRAGVQQVSALDAALKRLLPDYLASNVEPGTIKDDVLTLFAGHNALAARLRHLEPTVLAELQQRGFAIGSIRIRVRPQAMRAAPPLKQAQVSAAGAHCLLELANALDPSPLKEAVARMARRHSKP
jgi:hypothetical protein